MISKCGNALPRYAQKVKNCLQNCKGRGMSSGHGGYGADVAKGTMNELPIPQGSWSKSYEKANRMYNMQLAGGLVFTGLTAFVVYKSGIFPSKLFGPGHIQLDNPTIYPGVSTSDGSGTSSDDLKSSTKNTKAASGGSVSSALGSLTEPVPYLLVGAGTASLAAYRSIKVRDPQAKVLVISEEGEMPYMRPPLSKELWYTDDPDTAKNLVFKRWSGKEKSIYYEPEEFYSSFKELLNRENGGVSILKGRKVMRIDVTQQRAYLDNGDEIPYKKCLVATGGRPKSLPEFEGADIKGQVTLFRGIRDYQTLDGVVRSGKHVTIVGGGFLGSELAVAVGHKAKEMGGSVTQIFPESGNMAKVLPNYLSEWTTTRVRNEGIEVLTKSHVKSVTKNSSGKLNLTLDNGKQVTTDHVVIAVGLEPNVELAEASSLELDETQGGFKVNAELEARANLWVAGDAACFYDVKLGRRRVEHHDHAVVSGRLAGENMTGAGKPYWHQSMFWSDLGPEVGYEAIGIVDSKLPTFATYAIATEKDKPKAVAEVQWGLRSDTEASSDADVPKGKPSASSATSEQDYGKGIVFYLRDNTIVGIVLWNVFNQINIARRVLRESYKIGTSAGEHNEADIIEIAKLFDLYPEPTDDS